MHESKAQLAPQPLQRFQHRTLLDVFAFAKSDAGVAWRTHYPAPLEGADPDAEAAHHTELHALIRAHARGEEVVVLPPAEVEPPTNDLFV